MTRLPPCVRDAFPGRLPPAIWLFMIHPLTHRHGEWSCYSEYRFKRLEHNCIPTNEIFYNCISGQLTSDRCLMGENRRWKIKRKIKKSFNLLLRLTLTCLHFKMFFPLRYVLNPWATASDFIRYTIRTDNSRNVLLHRYIVVAIMQNMM